jgi:hypothetical protein
MHRMSLLCSIAQGLLSLTRVHDMVLNVDQ